jgi:hypothetical protein
MKVSTSLLARGGWAGLVAAAFFVTTTMINQFAPLQEPYVSATDYIQQAVLLLAFLAVVGAVTALTALIRSTGRMRTLSVVGGVLTGGGYLVVGLLNLANLPQGERAFVAVRQAAALVLLAGSALHGVLVLITRVAPWWCGVLLIIAFPLGDVVDTLLVGGEGLLLALLWVTVGIALVRRAAVASDRARAAARPRQVLR